MPPEGLGVSFAPPGLFHSMRRAITVIFVCAAASIAFGCAAPAREAVARDVSHAPAASPVADARAAAPISLGGGMTIDRTAREVRIEAEVACTSGWLEQAVCRAGTREHESLLVINLPPNRVHAALLLIGLQPGQPGRWEQLPDGASVRRFPPEGDAVDAWVEVAGTRVPLSSWIRDPVRGRWFPEQPWVFAGSRMRQLPPERGGGEQYVADATGSVIGIVTFGDEVVSFREVLSDKVETDAPEWQAATERMPEAGTRVTLVLTPSAPRGAAP